MGSSSMAEALRDPILLLRLVGGSRCSHRLCPLATASACWKPMRCNSLLSSGAWLGERKNFSAWGCWAASMRGLVVPPWPDFLSECGREGGFVRALVPSGGPFYAGAVHGKILWRVFYLILPSLKHSIQNPVLCPAAHSLGIIDHLPN